uniref:Uncharacterized protein n=1 Tax=Triticum urartu TaxID=4572 RepID=A0A8R7TPZ0_TRIUA
MHLARTRLWGDVLIPRDPAATSARTRHNSKCEPPPADAASSPGIRSTLHPHSTRIYRFLLDLTNGSWCRVIHMDLRFSFCSQPFTPEGFPDVGLLEKEEDDMLEEEEDDECIPPNLQRYSPSSSQDVEKHGVTDSGSRVPEATQDFSYVPDIDNIDSHREPSSNRNALQIVLSKGPTPTSIVALLEEGEEDDECGDGGKYGVTDSPSSSFASQVHEAMEDFFSMSQILITPIVTERPRLNRSALQLRGLKGSDLARYPTAAPHYQEEKVLWRWP